MVVEIKAAASIYRCFAYTIFTFDIIEIITKRRLILHFFIYSVQIAVQQRKHLSIFQHTTATSKYFESNILIYTG